jgi:hypothetical protein
MTTCNQNDQNPPDEGPTLSAMLHNEADRFKDLLRTRLELAIKRPADAPPDANYTTGNDGLAMGAAILRFAAIWTHFQEQAFALSAVLRNLQTLANTATDKEQTDVATSPSSAE